MKEIVNEIIGNGDFSQYSQEGIIDFNGKIGQDILYHGIRGTNQHDLGIVKNTNTTTRVALSHMAKPYSAKALCHFEYKTSQWDYVKKSSLEKDELKHLILIKTPKALAHKGKTHIKDCGGYAHGNVEAVLRVEYGKNENPYEFLANLFQTIEQSKNNALIATTQPKKLSKLNFVAKLAHLFHKPTQTVYQQQTDAQEILTNQDPFAEIYTGKPVELPHTDTDFDEPYHCNLRRDDWVNHTKLTSHDHEM